MEFDQDQDIGQWQLPVFDDSLNAGCYTLLVSKR